MGKDGLRVCDSWRCASLFPGRNANAPMGNTGAGRHGLLGLIRETEDPYTAKTTWFFETHTENRRFPYS